MTPRARSALLLGAVALSTAACGVTAGQDGSPRVVAVEPPPPEALSDTLVGWSLEDVPGGEQEVFGTWMSRDSWEQLARGEWLAENTDYAEFVATHPDRAADVGVPLVPHDSGQDLNALLDEAVAGGRDDVYRAMGAALAATGPRTVYARLWWEMNLSPQGDAIDPARFRAAWIHVAPLVEQGFSAAARPGQSLEVVFSPNAEGLDYEQFYPGDDVVDLVALDVYGQTWGTQTPGASQLLTQVDEQLARFSAFAEEHGKPVALGEWGNVADKPSGGDEGMRGRGDFPEYVALVLSWAAEHDAEYLVYFNYPAGGVEQTLDDTPESLALLREAAWPS